VGSDRAANVVQFVNVENNIVQGYSRVFADGEGISQANGHDITYLHNDITDGYHAGISVCLLGCPSHEANGNNILSLYNHIWNTMQGVTSDGGTLYYNLGSAGGSASGSRMLSNLVHDTTDASIIDRGVRGSGYGGAGLYLDIQTSGVTVENNVVFNVAAQGIFMGAGPAPGHAPNRIRNNIFAFPRKSMVAMATAWPQGCNGEAPRVNVENNIFVFDRDHTGGFYFQEGCAWSCGLDYNRFQNFDGNLYWRTDGKFATYDKAFHIITNWPREAQKCGQTMPVKNTTFLTWEQWRGATPPNGVPKAMGEEAHGTATVDPGFGHSGKPSDYLLTKAPVAGFDYTKTNDTIRNAGRNHPVIMPPAVGHTFPTYVFKEY
jgi:hypothetical protein